MTNLLPPKEKYRLAQKRRIKELIMAGFLILACLVSFALILFGVELYLRGKVTLEKAILEQARQEFQSSKEKGLEKEIKFYNETASRILSYEDEKLSLVGILEKMYEAKPEEVLFYDFSYVRKDGKVRFFGYSPKRSDLLELKSNLEQRFDNVSFPASSWVRSEDIEFSGSFTIDKNQDE